MSDSATAAVRRPWGLRACVFALIFCSGAWFYNTYNWNQVSRYDAIFSFVEPGSGDFLSFRIDHFLPAPGLGINTGDWAQNPAHSLHFYSNKAPGCAFLGVLAYLPLYWLERAAGASPRSHGWTLVNSYLLNLAVSVLPLALAGLAALGLFGRFPGVGPRLALSAVAALFLGTLLFPYATQLWGHGTAAALVVMALYFLRRGEDGDPWDLAYCGLLAGAAVLCEYSCAITVASIGILLLCRRDWPRLAPFCLGGLATLVLYGLYHYDAFGSPFTTANFHNNPPFRAADRAGGVFGGLSLEALWGLSFSPYRGLFYCMPVLLLCFPAGRGPWRGLAGRWRWLALANILGYFLMNLSFNGWHGGACLGPRYLIPSLPFYILFILPALPGWLAGPRRRAWTAAAGLLLLLSVANMSVIAAVSPLGTQERQPPWDNPLALWYRAYALDQFHPWRINPIRLDRPFPREFERGSYNLGEILGLEGRSSTLPWLALVLLLGTAAWRAAAPLPVNSPRENLQAPPPGAIVQ